MKQKIIYVLLALVLILIIIAYFLTQENVKTEPSSQQIKPQEEINQTEGLSGDYPYASESRPAITVIRRPAPIEKPVIREEAPRITKTEKSQQPDKGSASSNQGPTGPDTDYEETPLPEPEPSGVTKINKQPTEKQKQEMKVRGTVLF